MSFGSCAYDQSDKRNSSPLRNVPVVRASRQQRALAVVAGVAATVFVALTVIVCTDASLGIDDRAFTLARDLRTPWLTHAARVVTTLGIIAIVGPAVLLGAGLLIRSARRARATALVAGIAVTWILVWITKWLVDRSRPPAPLIHTTGQSYPSGHAANAVGWLALAIALAVLIEGRRIRIAVIALGAVVTALVGLSRIYLRAHFASDVLAGEALAVAVYALAAIGVRRRVTRIG